MRTAIMPQPMSTPTAAGMIAPRVGMTDPTVAPRPRWASGISATCGWMNGMRAVVTAWSRVPCSRIEAQLSSFALIFSIVDSCVVALLVSVPAVLRAEERRYGPGNALHTAFPGR